MKRLEADTFELISAHIVEECSRRGISGVFAMAEVQYPHTSRRTWVLLDGDWGKKMELLAIATTKLNVMRSSRTFSGGEIHMKYVADPAFKGKDGHRSQDGNFCYAFSGATDEVNGEIERMAGEYHETLG